MERTFKSIDEFKKTLVKDEHLQKEFRDDPVTAVEKLKESPLKTDTWVYRIVVGALGLTILVITLGVIILTGVGKVNDDNDIPTVITAIASAAIGALAGLLAPPPGESN
ncbi:hypothetical protein [Dyadobacter chenhuakuii]|uniref:Uncharacterized protein n=1 Tax=Dyadobacter chenhuakuii TaxID=2909339 RepID=A0ABY4XN37_9BACT|nr:hypothetical protein [Dyadobacter chenhuakuii]MCF2494303.1 hypothetical protein [Dyadobacter chenhuakuii]USJ31427.1 hypothetical protein NFI80_01535 [Dyadobacter chenhuakuii]